MSAPADQAAADAVFDATRALGRAMTAAQAMGLRVKVEFRPRQAGGYDGVAEVTRCLKPTDRKTP